MTSPFPETAPHSLSELLSSPSLLDPAPSLLPPIHPAAMLCGGSMCLNKEWFLSSKVRAGFFIAVGEWSLYVQTKQAYQVWVKEKQVLKLPPVPSTHWRRRGKISSPEGSASRSRQARVNANGKEGAGWIFFQQAGDFLRKYLLPSLAKGGRARTASGGSHRGSISSMDWAKVLLLRAVPEK